jgi:hypothetical protein
MVTDFLARLKPSRYVCLLLATSALVGSQALLSAQFQMPDPKQMSGIPRPVDDLPAGSISVRVIRGSLSNNIPDHPVQLSVAGKTLTAKTDDVGRAEFKGVTTGATVKASTDVDGEHLESQEFQVPANAGIRLMLVATEKAAAARPAVTGAVSIGNQSRFVLEPGDEAVRVFYLLMINNGQSTPVTPPQAFTFDAPADAAGTTILEGSSPLATANGTRVTVQGPFPPGQTFLQVGYELPSTGGSVQIQQRFPAPLEELNVVVKKVGDTRLSSGQIRAQQDMAAEGEQFIAATGAGVPAGQPVELSLSGLPHHSAAGRWLALALAIVIVGAGVWASRGRSAESATLAAERARLAGKREKLLNELARLEIDRRNGRVEDSRYVERRKTLMSTLEQVYGALDDDETTVDVVQAAAQRPPSAPPARDAVVERSAANA